MEGLTVRWLPFEIADGPHNMAADEVLLHTAADLHIASLRFYGWSPTTLSLGYFQLAAARLTNPRLAALPWVRRASGGATLVHDREVTYALALPPGAPWQTGESWIMRMHRVISDALTTLGINQPLAIAADTKVLGDVLCFQKQTPGDLVCAGAKVVGSAQRKQRQTLLQHGGILLGQSVFTPELPGFQELTGAVLSADQVAAAVVAAFGSATGWNVTPGAWHEGERAEIEKLATEKYSAAWWSERR